MSESQNNKKLSGADRDATSEELAKDVPPAQSDDLFTDRGAVDVSSPKGDAAGENKVANSLDDE